MARELIGVGLSFVVIFMVLGVAAFAKKQGWALETCRKLVHILVSNWIILALFVIEQTWAVLIVPASFVVLNYLSYRKGIFKGIEREEDNTPGTVWYAVTLLILSAVGWSLGVPWVAACGILAMGYGDGFAALVGERWGKHHFPAPYSKKTVEGSLTVLFFSGLSVGVLCLIFAPQIALPAAFVGGVAAMAAELYFSRGLDNLTLPLSVSLVVLLMVYFPASVMVLVYFALTLLILLAAFYLRSVGPSGLHTATLVGSALYFFGGWLSYGALILFFLAGSFVSRMGKQKKTQAYILHQRGGPRGAVQVLANAGPGLILAAGYHFSGQELFLLAVLAGFSAAAADTFSSEIGMLSKTQPVSILTLRRVERGLSGGVTPLGLCGGGLGALVIAMLALPFFGWGGVAVVFLCGVLGSVLDSVMGAALQAKYLLPQGGLTERKILGGKPLPLARGLAWVNNDLVNFVSPLLVSAVCLLVVL